MSMVITTPSHADRPHDPTDPDDPDDQPLAAVRAGRPGAWADLVHRYQRLLIAVARRRGATSDQAEDVAQSTWLQLHRNLDRIRDDRCLPSWLMVTASREALAVLIKERRECPSPDLDRMDRIGTDDTDAVLESVSLSSVSVPLRAALLTLPERERLLLQLLFSREQPSYREISRRLRMPIGAIGPVRARALAHLRHELSAYEQILVAA